MPSAGEQIKDGIDRSLPVGIGAHNRRDLDHVAREGAGGDVGGRVPRCGRDRLTEVVGIAAGNRLDEAGADRRVFGEEQRLLGRIVGEERRDRDAGSAIGALVLVDSVGIEVAGQPVRDFFSLSPREIADYTFCDGDRFYSDPSQMDPAQAEAMRANMATLRVLAGDPYMYDPGLRERLAEVTPPALAIWGDSDGIASPSYGRALAQSLANCRFELVAAAGHVPQLEQPDVVFSLIDSFANETA